MSVKPKLVILSSLGGLLEFYDFVIFALLAKALSVNFFSGNEFSSLLKTYSIFAAGYLARPLGGMILAHIGDRYGRRNVFLFSIFFMTCATFLIGCLPSYQSAGLWAPVLLSALRIIQGLCIGGEIPGAITYIYEHMSEKNRPFGGSIITGTASMGILLGSFVMACLTSVFSEPQIMSYGWRIPFIIGGIAGILSWITRFSLLETPEFMELDKKGLQKKLPIFDVARNFKASFFTGFVIAFSQCIVVTSVYMILPAFMTDSFNYPMENIFWFNTIGMLVLAMAAMTAGFIVSRLGAKYWIVAIAANILTICFIIPFFNLLGTHSAIPALCGFLTISLISGTANSTYSVMMADLYPVSVRYSGVAASHNIGNALAGGFTPLIIMAISLKTGISHAFTTYIIIVLLIGTVFIGLTPLCRRGRE